MQQRHKLRLQHRLLRGISLLVQWQQKHGHDCRLLYMIVGVTMAARPTELSCHSLIAVKTRQKYASNSIGVP